MQYEHRIYIEYTTYIHKYIHDAYIHYTYIVYGIYVGACIQQELHYATVTEVGSTL